MACTKPSSTIDYETDNNAAFLKELEQSFKKFNDAITNTLNAYRDLLIAFDQVGEVYSSMANRCDDSVKLPIDNFSKGMRELKEHGPFVTFNSEVHSGTVELLDPLKGQLKAVQKAYLELKSKQNDYDKLRSDVEKTEKSYAKKDKPLSDSKSYRKSVEKRDKSKAIYEERRDTFKVQVSNLQTQAEGVLVDSMNRYLQSSATFCGCLEATMQGYRTNDIKGEHSKLAEMKEAAVAKSALNRPTQQRLADSRKSDYPTDNSAMSPVISAAHRSSNPLHRDDYST